MSKPQIQLPERLPEPGFYYNHHHDPSKGVGDHAYEVLGLQIDVETSLVRVDYRPLYQSALVYQLSLRSGVPCKDGRPVDVFMQDVEKDGKKVPRFAKITDPSAINKLIGIRRRMYGKSKLSKIEMALSLLGDLELSHHFPQLFSDTPAHIRKDDGSLMEETFRGALQITMSPNGDLWVGNNRRGQASQFSQVAISGGGSPSVWNALLLLAFAMMLDNKRFPQDENN